MAFADPQSITVDSVPHSMPRISDEATKSIYLSADGAWQLTISHQLSGNRIRHMARIDQTTVASDPLTSANVEATAGIYLVIDEPKAPYFEDASLIDVVTGFTSWLATSGYVGKILGQEH